MEQQQDRIGSGGSASPFFWALPLFALVALASFYFTHPAPELASIRRQYCLDRKVA